MCIDNKAFERICVECGAVIDSNSNKHICPNCGTDNSSNTNSAVIEDKELF